ncbi:putative RNA-binding protein 23 [Camellia lanceoleosa]|uniref:RNA-binding protein 23 n=1 Tax=Camellia lanceoleosa TaxID=1840588 RepID=A0ACC0FZL1_9ERIC|nr:putative RNA-binding protein 23 [Camellia lanceoleosa]
MDRNSRRSKRVGYIEFFDAMSVPMAIALSGQPLLGHPIMVKPSEAKKNLVQSTTGIAGVVGGLIGLYLGVARRVKKPHWLSYPCAATVHVFDHKIVRLPSQIARFSKVGIELSLFLVP